MFNCSMVKNPCLKHLRAKELSDFFVEQGEDLRIHECLFIYSIQ